MWWHLATTFSIVTASGSFVLAENISLAMNMIEDPEACVESYVEFDTVEKYKKYPST